MDETAVPQDLFVTQVGRVAAPGMRGQYHGDWDLMTFGWKRASQICTHLQFRTKVSRPGARDGARHVGKPL